MLDNVLGPGKAVVRVAVEMDMSSTERSAETYNPVPGTSSGL